MLSNRTKKIKEKFTIKNRFRYWFDNRMSKGMFGLIRVLITASVIFAILIGCLIIALGFNDEGGPVSVYWDSIATLINGWMPDFESGNPGYVILMSVIAVAGLLFTSVLIGFITGAVEEKVYSLKQGNSFVLEKDHIVILGFYPGEFTLLRQLILAAAGKPACVVIGENMEREKIEQNIEENIQIPDNIRIVCRTIDITDPASIEKCSVETCKSVIISPTDDMRTMKAVLAVSMLLDEKGVSDVGVNALISKDEYRLPQSIAEVNNISTLQTNNILARIIAHSCTQTGLSHTFREIYNFEGSEFYLTDFQGLEGLRFEELMVRIDRAVPAGVFRDEKISLNPGADFVLRETDRILVFSEESDSAIIVDAPSEKPGYVEIRNMDMPNETGTVIIGYNETLPVILHELPANVTDVCFILPESSKHDIEMLEKEALKTNRTLNYYEGNPHEEYVLFEIANMAKHIIILNDHDLDPEESDMEAIFLLLNLRDIKKRYDLHFNITVEMQKERNQKLVGHGDHTDFLVSSSMSSLFLAQLAECPELKDVFREILSNSGNEVFLKNVAHMKMQGSYTTRNLRYIMLRNGYILLGILNKEKESRYNFPLDEMITLTSEDNLIVIGKERKDTSERMSNKEPDSI